MPLARLNLSHFQILQRILIASRLALSLFYAVASRAPNFDYTYNAPPVNPLFPTPHAPAT